MFLTKCADWYSGSSAYVHAFSRSISSERALAKNATYFLATTSMSIALRSMVAEAVVAAFNRFQDTPQYSVGIRLRWSIKLQRLKSEGCIRFDDNASARHFDQFAGAALIGANNREDRMPKLPLLYLGSFPTNLRKRNRLADRYHAGNSLGDTCPIRCTRSGMPSGTLSKAPKTTKYANFPVDSWNRPNALMTASRRLWARHLAELRQMHPLGSRGNHDCLYA